VQYWVGYDDNGCFFIGELVFRRIRCLTIARLFLAVQHPAWSRNAFRLSRVHRSVAVAFYCVREIMAERSSWTGRAGELWRAGDRHGSHDLLKGPYRLA
jgi:hypothetical protein